MKFRYRLLTAVSLIGSVLSQTPTEYVDSDIDFTGITESVHGVTYGFVLPPANESDSAEFIGQVIAPLENKWVGVALGGPNSLMLVAWPNETTIFGSPRYVDSDYQAAPYDNANVSTIGSTVNETHWKWTYRCENCTSWPGGSLALHGSQPMSWLVGFAPVETPEAENSTLSQFSDIGQWEQDLVDAQNANYSNFVNSSSSLWTPNIMFPSGVGQSQYKPALAAHAGRLWAVGVVGNHSLWYASGNNTKWDQSTTWVNNEVTQEGPAVAEFAGVLHLVFPDKTSGSLVHLQYNDTTAVWGQRIVLNVTTSGQPALAVFNGSLAMVYYDPSDSNRLHAAAWDPVGWGSFTNLGELTWGTPSLYTVGTATELYLLFPANNNGRTILEISTTAVNGTWGRVTAPNEQSAFGTSAAKFGNTAAMGFQSNNGKGQVLVSFWNGTSWLPHENVASQTSSHTPALAVLDGILNCIFPSHNSNEVVLWAQRPLLAYPLDSWMAHLDGGLYISQLSLPGTHDSAAVTDVPFTETQTMSITEQLAAGIRFFDLRCVLIADTLQMYHGIVSLDTTLNTILQQMYTWFLGSPTRANEGLVVSIKQEGATQDSSMQFDFAVYATVQQSGFWVTNATIPQLQQLRRKIQLVRRYTAVDNTTVGVDFRIGIDASAWGDLVPTPNGALVIEDNYDYDGVVGFASVVANKTAIVEAALAAAMADTVATNWHISFSSASNTPFHPPSSIALGGVSITSPLNPFVVGVNRRLLTYVNPLLLVPAPRAQVGTVLMDFPDSPNGGGLIAAIIELNG